MSQEETLPTVEESIKVAQSEITERFKKYVSEEFLTEVPVIGERSNQLLEEFTSFKEEKEATTFEVSGSALEALRTIFKDYLNDIPKSVSDSERYINVHQNVVLAGKSVVEGVNGDITELTTQELQYIGDVFSGCTFTSFDEAKTVRGLQNDIKELYQAQYLNAQSISWAAETVQQIEGRYQLEGLPKEEDMEQNVNEISEEVEVK